MSRVGRIPWFGGLAYRVQGLFSRQTGASAAPASATLPQVDTQTQTMPDHARSQRTIELERALGSVLFAIEAFPREDLLTLGERFMSLRGFPTPKSLAELSDDELRKFLAKCAKRLRKENSADLVVLAEKLVDFARAEIAKSSD